MPTRMTIRTGTRTQRHDHHHHHHHDHNFRAAYVHVVADALTSVLAIVALAGGLWFGWTLARPCGRAARCA